MQGFIDKRLTSLGLLPHSQKSYAHPSRLLKQEIGATSSQEGIAIEMTLCLWHARSIDKVSL
jgi:hypothetical protein